MFFAPEAAPITLAAAGDILNADLVGDVVHYLYKDSRHPTVRHGKKTGRRSKKSPMPNPPYTRGKKKFAKWARSVKHTSVPPQVAALGAQLNSLQKATNALSHWAQYSMRGQLTCPPDCVTIIPLIQPNHWKETFQANAETSKTNKFKIRNLELKTIIRPHHGIKRPGAEFQEPHQQPSINVEVYVVSLNGVVGSQFRRDMQTKAPELDNTQYHWPLLAPHAPSYWLTHHTMGSYLTDITDPSHVVFDAMTSAAVPISTGINNVVPADITPMVEDYWSATQTRITAGLHLKGPCMGLTYLNPGVFTIKTNRQYLLGTQLSRNYVTDEVTHPDSHDNLSLTKFPTSQLSAFTKVHSEKLSWPKEIKSPTGFFKDMTHVDVATGDQLYLMIIPAQVAGYACSHCGVEVSVSLLANGQVAN